MPTADRSLLLIVAGLAAIGAMVVVGELLGQLDRLRMAVETTDELGRLPLTTDDGEED